MTIPIHAIRTGFVRLKSAQVTRSPGGPVRVLGDRDWSEPRPIHAWLIDHPEGPLLVDTGETCRACARGYFARWHPYYRGSVAFAIAPDEEVGPALAELGLRPRDIRAVLLTHLHTDHAGGLAHFPHCAIFVSAVEWGLARGAVGRLRGYVPNRWPTWFAPRFYEFSGPPLGPFAASSAVTKAGDVLVVPTPGHTPGHVSVVVRTGGMSFFLAGDASYDEASLLAGVPDGVTFFPRTAVQTLADIRAYAHTHPTVYLPSHDPHAQARLRAGQVTTIASGGALVAANGSGA